MTFHKVQLTVTFDGPDCPADCEHQNCWLAEVIIGTLMDIEEVEDVIDAKLLK